VWGRRSARKLAASDRGALGNKNEDWLDTKSWRLIRSISTSNVADLAFSSVCNKINSDLCAPCAGFHLETEWFAASPLRFPSAGAVSA